MSTREISILFWYFLSDIDRNDFSMDGHKISQGERCAKTVSIDSLIRNKHGVPCCEKLCIDLFVEESFHRERGTLTHEFPWVNPWG
jgi:hypothetical protein